MNIELNMVLRFVISYNLLWLLYSSTSTLASQFRCPLDCACSQDTGKLSVAKCDQLPLLNEFFDIGSLQIQSRSSNTCPISEDLSKFANLKKLHVSHCAVDICANSFKNLTDLQSVAFHNTSLNHFNPLLFESNRHLKIVNLSSNPLKIWRHLLISASVEEVDLTNCDLKSIPKHAFSQILNLKRLTLRNNSFKNLDTLLPTSVTYLDLSNNHLENIPVRALRRLGNLRELIISGNPFVCSCGLKLMDRYMLMRNITFSRPEKCTVGSNKEPVVLDTLLIKDICVDVPDNLNHLPQSLQRTRRWADIESSAEEIIEPNVEAVESEEAVDKTTAEPHTTSAGNHTTAADKEPHLIKPLVFYLIIGLIFLLLVLIIIIMVGLCCKMASKSDDNCKMSVGTAAAVKMCQQTLARDSEETVELMSRSCTTNRKGSCRICPKTMRNKRDSCRSTVTTECGCDAETATECSDNETVVNDCDYATTNASSSACTTFERRC